MKPEILKVWRNGNAKISIMHNGSRIVKWPDNEPLKLATPLNVDIRISTRCAFGENPKGTAICSFCHESARTDGIDADLNLLFEKIKCLPGGTELAIGVNQFTEDFENFLARCTDHGFICNITVNHGHIFRDKNTIIKLINKKLIHGLGISFRKGFKQIPWEILDYDNVVVHVIAGIDNLDDVYPLADDVDYRYVSKILILGEKDFGFNNGKVNLESASHKQWYREFYRLFKVFQHVSFDNLALEQLNVKRFIPQKTWDKFYQHEFSFYINAVDGYYSPSSRSLFRTDWNNIGLKEFFDKKVNQQG